MESQRAWRGREGHTQPWKEPLAADSKCAGHYAKGFSCFHEWTSQQPGEGASFPEFDTMRGAEGRGGRTTHGALGHQSRQDLSESPDPAFLFLHGEMEAQTGRGLAWGHSGSQRWQWGHCGQGIFPHHTLLIST